MRKLLSILLVMLPVIAFTQTQQDTIQLIRNMAAFYDLDYTANEADSMISNMRNNQQLYKNLHKTLPANDIPYPLAFNPVPFGMEIKRTSQRVVLPMRLGVQIPKNKNDLAFYSIAELAGLIKEKKITSLELTQFFLERLKKWSDTLQCTITITEDTAIAQAKKADEEMRKGKYRGVLHGIPYGLKDLFAVKGYKTTWGSTPYKDQYIDQDAFVYIKLKEAGAVLCAKLTLGALAQNNKWFGGETKNPWNLNEGSSGSSAGSASATVAGLLPFAIGTETLGSIVSPSTRCGATGLRPTFGSVSRSGAMVLCWTLDKIGPICRSAEDAAIVFNYIKGTDGKDPGSVDKTFNYNGVADFTKLRVAYADNYFKRLRPADSAVQKVLDVYRAMGADLKAIEFPDSTLLPYNFIPAILGAESSAAFDELTRTNRDDLVERQDRGFWPNSFRSGQLIPAVEYINANRYRYQLCKAFNDFMKDYDVIIFPTFSGRQLALTNLTGHPVVVMPVGFNQTGSPISITLIGNLYDEATILAAAKAYQDKTDFNKKHPEKFKN
jgi:Asp-tRNA(Asn)/Glu-tRNA(Gln) amidotransferase A subunit family amidase